MDLHDGARHGDDAADPISFISVEDRLAGHVPATTIAARTRRDHSRRRRAVPVAGEGRLTFAAIDGLRSSIAAAAAEAAAHTRRRVRMTVAALLATILSFGGVALPANAVIASNGQLGGFEIDGNLVEDPSVPGGIDWNNAGNLTPVPDDTIDSAFQGSSKELDPDDWVCQSKAGGVTPGKDNLLRAYVNTRITATSAYLDLGFVRQEGEGDTHINFEFNKNGVVEPYHEGPCGIDREVGDLLFTYDFGGTSDPTSTVRAWRWNGSNWIELALPAGSAVAANNAGAITDPLNNNALIPARAFGELTIDLSRLPGFAPSCPGLGYVNVRSRSAGSSFDSALQDKMPTTAVDLSTCGSVKLRKTDELGNPLVNARFGLYSTSGTLLQECTTDAQGLCSFPEVAPGTYDVKEIAAPAGYTPSSEVRRITVAFRQDVDLSATPFTNPLIVGAIRITKTNDANGAAVAGIRFQLLTGTTVAKTRTGADAACTTAADGTCTITNVIPGTYTLHEDASTVPATMTAVADRQVTIVGNQTLQVAIVDPVKPRAISLSKLVNGEKSVTVHAGDTVTYTLRATNTGQVPIDVTSLVDNNGSPVVLPAGCLATVAATTYIAPGASQALCTYTAAPTADVVNRADVVGADAFGRTATAFSTAAVDVITPAITLIKTVNGDDSLVTSPGTALGYRIEVTNTGDTPLTVQSFTDVETPGGPVSLASCLPVGTVLAVGQMVPCTYTDTAPAGGVTNTAEVVAVDKLGGDKGTVRAADTVVVSVLSPGLELTKLVNGEEEVTVHEGDDLVYVITIRNTGDAPIEITSFGDVVGTGTATVPGNCSTVVSSTLLAPGASRSCTYTVAAGTTDRANTATVDAVEPTLGSALTSSDTALAHVIDPDISIVKTASPVLAHEGDAVTYSLVITNTGNTPLTLVALTDKLGANAAEDILGECGFSISTKLAPGASVECDYAGVAGAEDTTNVAEVVAVDSLGGPKGTVDDDDDAVVDVIHPAIVLTKSVSAPAVHAGDTVTYTVRFQNTGDTALTLTALADKVGAADAVDILARCGFSTTTVLQPTQVETCTYDVVVGASDITNVATVRAVDVVGGVKGQVTSTDDAVVEVLDPDITIDKTASPLVVRPGQNVTYTLVITNVGDTPLTITSLTDVANGQSAVLSDECLGLVGDVLAAGASTDCTYVVPAGADDVHNVATVFAVDRLDLTVDDDDDADVEVIVPEIEVTKSADKALVHAGDVVTYSVTITNIGDSDLRLTSLTDAVNGAAAIDILERCGLSTETVLEPGESTPVCTYTMTAGPTDVRNVVVVEGIDVLGGTVDDDDDAVVDVLNPAITIVKSVDEPVVHAGDTVTYTLVVTNTGDAALTITSLDDAVNGGTPLSLVDCGIIGQVLAAGASAECRYTAVVGTTDLVNVATVEGEDELDKEVEDDDDAVVDVLNPAITIVKTGSTSSISGTSGPVTFSYLVTNTGDAVLTDVQVTDDILGFIGSVSRLAPGESVTLTKDAVVSQERPVNVGTVTGRDELDKEVSDTDDERITFVQDAVFVRPLPAVLEAAPAPTPAPAPAPQPLARTGVDAADQVRVGLILLVLGGMAVLPERIRRRRLTV